MLDDFKIDLQLFAEEAAADGGLLSTETEDKGEGLLSGEGDKESETASEDGKTEQGTDDKAEENKGAEGDSDENKKEKPAGAPEQYEAFKVPDGFTIEDAAVNEFGALAKELNLTQEAAQKLVDYQVKFQQAQTAKLDEAVKKQAEDWAADTLKTYKKDELADARRGFKAAPKDVQQMLAAAGFDNHKSFVDFFMKVGRAIKEDKFEMGKGKGGQAKSPANVIYPELN